VPNRSISERTRRSIAQLITTSDGSHPSAMVSRPGRLSQPLAPLMPAWGAPPGASWSAAQHHDQWTHASPVVTSSARRIERIAAERYLFDAWRRARPTLKLGLGPVTDITPEDARRYLTVIGQGDDRFTFQRFHDKWNEGPHSCHQRHAREARSLADRVEPVAFGRFRDGRRQAIMVRPRVVFVEADHGIPESWPLPPSVTVETSPGRFQLIWSVTGLTWEQFDDVLRRMVAEHGSDPNAQDRTPRAPTARLLPSQGQPLARLSRSSCGIAQPGLGLRCSNVPPQWRCTRVSRPQHGAATRVQDRRSCRDRSRNRAPT
jgi:hypothetical protein